MHGHWLPLRPSRKEKKRKAKVIFSYLPENADELRLDNGDVVTILDQEEEGWLRGLLHGKEGVFPSNFVEEISDSDVEEVTEKKDKEKEKTENETDSHKEKKRVPGIKGPGFGDIFSQGPIKLKSTGGASDRKVSPEVAGGAGRQGTHLRSQ
ncbi:PREDICTED: SH3 domain-containing kinase-binding protein 1-like [Priapulus caudatus]|uniref:SH3 domain-containing kinase-binding protein 1-like n=1 Tax=Priapulus caudatus TaxID=37621 RepID=A0ABM1EXX2_PRICU|nr:PREDICTED: SH3 domain-containing kinase-binding protein 1-like [Priapulus caudatus]